MNYYKTYLKFIKKREIDIKSQISILDNYEKNKNYLLRFNYSWANRFIKNYIEYSLVSDKCLLRNNFLRKYFLVKSDINNTAQDNNKLKIYISILIFACNITSKLFLYIFETFNYLLISINNFNYHEEFINLKKQKRLFIIYPDDELNKNNFSRYKAKNNLRISISKPLYGIKLLKKLYRLEKEFSKEKYNVKAIEKYIDLRIIFQALLVGLILWLLIFLKSFNFILSFLVSSNCNKSSNLNFKLDFMNTFLAGGLIRRLTICFTLKKILEHNRNTNIYFPIEGAYWEKYLIEKNSNQNCNLFGILFSIPKILDFRYQNLLPKYESAGVNINKSYSQEESNSNRKIGEGKYNKLFNQFILDFKNINSSEEIVFYLTGRSNIDKEIIKDALLIIKKLDLDMIYLKVHPDTDMNLFKGIETKTKILYHQKKSTKIIFGSIHSSYIYDISLTTIKTLVLKFNVNNNIDSYVDPFKLKRVIYYDKINDILER